MRSLILWLLLLAGALASGCFSAEMYSELRADGSGVDTFRISTSSLLGAAVKKAAQENTTDENVKVSFDDDGETATVSFTRELETFNDVYSLAVSPADPASSPMRSGRVSTGNYLFFKTFKVREKYASSSDEPADKSSMGDAADRVGDTVSGMLSVKRTIKMPGSIVSANTQQIDKKAGAATWNVSMAELKNGYEMEVSSRWINWPAVAGALIVMAVFAGAAVLGGKK